MKTVLLVSKPLARDSSHFYLSHLPEGIEPIVVPKLTTVKLIREWIQENISIDTAVVLCSISAITKALTGKNSIQAQGYVLDTEYGYKLISMPSYEQRFHAPERITEAIDRAKDAYRAWLRGSYKEPGADVIHSATYVLDNDLAGLNRFLQSLHSYPSLSCDIETYSLKHYSAGIGSIAFAWDKHNGGVIYVNNNPEYIEALAQFFVEYQGTLMYHNCLTGDHEVKTRNGWVRLDTLDNNTEILQFDPNTSRASFVKPLAVIRKNCSGEVIEWDTEFHSGIYTPNHRFVYATPANEKWRIASAQEVAEFGQNNVYIPSAFIIEGTTNALPYSDDQLRLIEAVRADGSIQNTTIAFKLKKARKINRLVQLLQNTNTPFSLTNCGKVTRISILKCPLKQFILEFLGENKEYPLTVLDLPLEQRVVLVEETRYWDGHTPRDSKMSWRVSSHKSNEIRFIEDLARSSGYTVRVHFHDKSNCRGFSSVNSKLSQILIRRKSRIKLAKKPLKKYFEGMVYCVTVPTGAFVTRRCNNVWVTGNCAFDVYVLIYVLYMDFLTDQKGLLYGLEILLRNWDCTQLITYLATNSCSGNHLSLKEQAQEFAGDYALTEIKDITQIPVEDLLKYNLIDACSTWYVYNKHWGTVVADNQLTIYRDLFKPSTVDVIQMQLTGAPINLNRVQEVSAELTALETTLIEAIRTNPITIAFTDWLNQEWVTHKNSTLKNKKVTLADAKKEFNPNSGKQLGKLITWLNLPVLDTTDTGAIATGKNVIRDYLNHTDDTDIKALFAAIADLSDIQKITSSFIPALLNSQYDEQTQWWYLFGNFRLGGTVSGRMSSNSPNLQNLPSGSKYGKLIKSCFQAPDGFLFVGLDFAALEAKINALLTRDPEKMKIYLEGYDSHCLNTYTYWPELLPDIKQAEESDECFECTSKDGKETIYFKGTDIVTYKGTSYKGTELFALLTSEGL